MEFTKVEELLLLNKAAIFDAAGILCLSGIVLAIININEENRRVASICGWLFVLGVFVAAATWAVELHGNDAQSKYKGTPYCLSGYYSSH